MQCLFTSFGAVPVSPFNLHKLLGLGCLLSYALRLIKAGERDMGFSSSLTTLASIALHVTLSVFVQELPRSEERLGLRG